jgi:hypothetical protein
MGYFHCRIGATSRLSSKKENIMKKRLQKKEAKEEIKKEDTELNEEELLKVAGGTSDATSGGNVIAKWDIKSNKGS